MSGIDDPLDAIKQQYPEHLNPVSVLIDVGAEIHPFAGMVNAVRNFFSKREVEARVKALLQALEWYVRENERCVEELSEKVNSPEFIETMLVAVDETLRTANVEKIKRFAYVLGHELISDGDAQSYEDAATYIRTLSELSEADIEVLSIIHAFQADFLSDEGGARKPEIGKLFDGMLVGVRGEVAARGIPHDEFQSRCSKLNGYGLLHRLSIAASFWSSSNNVSYKTGGAYHITRSGKKLIDILGNSSELLTVANEHRQQVLTDIERFEAKLINSFPQPYCRKT